MIGRDVVGKDREWLMSKATPWPLKLANEPVVLSENFDSVRNAFIFCTLTGAPVDEIVAGQWGKLDGPYKLIEAGYWPMITKLSELVKMFLSCRPRQRSASTKLSHQSLHTLKRDRRTGSSVKNQNLL